MKMKEKLYLAILLRYLMIGLDRLQYFYLVYVNASANINYFGHLNFLLFKKGSQKTGQQQVLKK